MEVHRTTKNVVAPSALASNVPIPPRRSAWLHGRTALLIAFAFSVMADPISSVAYAIEAALRALHGNLALLLPAMALVVVVVAIVVASYHQLVGRFPEGGGSSAAAGRAFGEGFAFVPIGELIVDFVLTIAISVSAGTSAIAQLAQLDDSGRRRFGRWASWLTLGVVGTLTLALTVAAVRLGGGLPGDDSTLIAELARSTESHGVFAAFQAATALLLLSAASPSFQAGPGLLKALAHHDRPGEANHGVLPRALGTANRRHVPVLGVVVFLALSALVVSAAGARDQRLVLFYAVAVFVSFLMGLVAMATFSHREGRRGWVVLNVVAAIAVAFTLVANVMRPDALGSLAATALVAGGLYWAWVRAGRPRGSSEAMAEATDD